MKRLIHAGNNVSVKTYILEASNTTIKGNAINVPVGAHGDYPERYRVWIPLNKKDGSPICTLRNATNNQLKLSIPTWLLDKLKGNSILCGDDIIHPN